MKTTAQLFALAFIAMIATGCGKKSIKGSDLKGEDAIEFLTGKSSKTWELNTGRDFYQYISFSTDKKSIDHTGHDLTFSVDANKLTIHDIYDVKYEILEISDEELKAVYLSTKDTISFIKSSKTAETGKKLAEDINLKWLKGKHGTVWLSKNNNQYTSYMNDGRMLDPTSGRVISDWSITDNILTIGAKDTESKLGPMEAKVTYLSPLSFEYEIFGIKVTLSYICEADADGKMTKI